jgi:SAM-dependent methyltransferase
MKFLKFLRRAKNLVKTTFYNKYNEQKLDDIFNNIYQNRLWGEDSKDYKFFSGEGSHDQNLTKEYINHVTNFIKKTNCLSILDLGCGDFRVGKCLAPHTEKYYAADVSDLVVEQNKDKYKDLNVEFIHLDATIDAIPKVDLIIVRQVLQHLSNQDINKVLNNINLSKPKYLCITEHLPIEKSFTSNIDKPTDHGIRLSLGSGVRIEDPTFLFAYKSKSKLISINTIAEGLQSRLVTYLYVL